MQLVCIALATRVRVKGEQVRLTVERKSDSLQAEIAQPDVESSCQTTRKDFCPFKSKYTISIAIPFVNESGVECHSTNV